MGTGNPEKLYVHVTSRDPSDEYDNPPSQLVLSPHPDDSCDAVAFGYEHHNGQIPDEETRLFHLLANLYNAHAAASHAERQQPKPAASKFIQQLQAKQSAALRDPFTCPRCGSQMAHSRLQGMFCVNPGCRR